MKLAVTVNLGNYESIRIESSEWDRIDLCRVEVDRALESFREPKVEGFRKRIFGDD